MGSNPLVEVAKLGQSIWYDNIKRALITSGDLKRMIDEDALSGMTSNPSIFEKAIGGTADYDDQLFELAGQGKKPLEIYEALAVRDIQMAADEFRPIFDRTGGADGFVSIECSPRLAADTAGTIDEARRLWSEVSRPNVMIKIPATPEGIPAVEQCIYEGININITLMFSVVVYQQVAEAYIKGIERRLDEGKPVSSISSVASFFVSRVDTLVDKLLQEKITAAPAGDRQGLESILGKVAVANARIAYQWYKDLFKGDRFKRAASGGARVQRPLWGSTSAKNPAYRDVYYVEALIGPETVDTVPPETLNAFRDHGRAEVAIENDLDNGRDLLKRLEEAGISLDQVTAQLLDQGVKAFADSFDKLLDTIAKRVEKSCVSQSSRQVVSQSPQAALQSGLKELSDKDFMRRLWRKDASLWKSDPSSQKQISGALGWLGVVDMMNEQVADLLSFAAEARGKFSHAVLLGMGGSSLCPEVFRRSFGKVPGYPELLVLDSTVPAAVRAIRNKIDPAKTLFIVSSKSGTTTEPNVFMEYFYGETQAKVGSGAAGHFVAITDPGTRLETVARDRGYRRVFLNPADIGGRYSALSFFGLVPAAVAGFDVREILARAGRAMHAADGARDLEDNPAARLGACLGALARGGVDKLTLIVPPPIDSLGLWVEQLIAESTGKEGRGVLPVAGEPLGPPQVYGNDRVFVYMRTPGSDRHDAQVALDLENAGHPVIARALHDALDLGEEFFTWEIATAIAGAFIDINPFDQPNVQESKDNTRRLLDTYIEKGSFGPPAAIAQEGAFAVFSQSESSSGGGGLLPVIRALLGKVKAGDYVALTAYIEETPEHEALLQQIRSEIRDAKKVATTVGYGPRFLHSTGQLHKGGPDTGVFIQITADPGDDVQIPGEKFTFGVLAAAQAQGDFESLTKRNRRAIRFHAGADKAAGLHRLLELVRQAVSSGSGAVRD